MSLPADAITAPPNDGRTVVFVPTQDGLELHVEGLPPLRYATAAEADQLMRAVQLGWERTQLKRGLP